MMVMFAGAPDRPDLGEPLDMVDGIELTGARANVYPPHSAGAVLAGPTPGQPNGLQRI